MSFHVGQRVVCVDDSGYPERHSYDPAKGQVFTIKASLAYDGQAVVELYEVRPRPGWLPFYLARRFRPIIERKRKTSIAVFKKMLAPNKREVEPA